MMTAVESWIKENNLSVSSKEVPYATHLLMNGGSYFIPKNKEYTFLTHYAKDLENKKPLYCVELRQKIFKYFIDIDITDDHYWGTEEITILVKNIQFIIKDFFNEDHSTICLISATKTKTDGVHTGIHLIWHDIFVTSETALVMRVGLLHKLKEGSIKLSKSWESIIDEGVYTRHGYRMVGSDKMMKKGIPENRPLYLLFVMNFKGELRNNHYDRLKRDIKALVLETSIRYILDSCKDVGMLIKYPEWLDHEQIKLKMPECSFNFSVASSKEHKLIEMFIRDKLPKAYSRIKIKSVKRIAPDKNYKSGRLYIEADSKYCLNIGREHNSCGIYFFATEHGLWQKCFCACDKLECRKKGLCKDFMSDCFKFENSLRNALFPECLKEEPRFIEESVIYSDKNRTVIDNKLCDTLFDDIFKVKVPENVKKKKSKTPMSKEEFLRMCGQ